MEGLEHPLGGASSEPRRARSILRAALEQAPRSAVRAAELVASELVTNAIVHGEPPRSMSVGFDGAHITITVQDAGAEPPQLRRSSTGSNGFGLRLVDALSESWGCRRVGHAKRVHAVLPAGLASGGMMPRT